MNLCGREHCYAPDVMCVLGLDDCANLAGGADEGAARDSTADGHRLPWSGLALGSGDLPAVTGLGRVHLVAVVGAAGAGKTTALAAHWLAARRGAGRWGPSFAGSYTLQGWHQIARHLQWGADSRGFPPHTSATSGRVPALLHYAVTHDGTVKHLLYADVPGEWYRAWAMDVNAVPGANWIAAHAASFVLLADTVALSGPERGRARADYQALARRVASAAAGRPVVPVRTKADVELRETWRAQVEDLNRNLFDADTTPVSVYEASALPLTEVVARGTTEALANRTVVLPDSEPSADAFLRYRSPRVPR